MQSWPEKRRSAGGTRSYSRGCRRPRSSTSWTALPGSGTSQQYQRRPGIEATATVAERRRGRSNLGMARVQPGTLRSPPTFKNGGLQSSQAATCKGKRVGGAGSGTRGRRSATMRGLGCRGSATEAAAMAFIAEIDTPPTRVLTRGPSRIPSMGLNGGVGPSAAVGHGHTCSSLHPVSSDHHITSLTREVMGRITSKVMAFKAGIE